MLQCIWPNLSSKSTFSMIYISIESVNHFDQNTQYDFLAYVVCRTHILTEGGLPLGKATGRVWSRKADGCWSLEITLHSLFWGCWRFPQLVVYKNLPRTVCKMNVPSINERILTLSAFYICGYIQNYWLSKGRTLEQCLLNIWQWQTPVLLQSDVIFYPPTITIVSATQNCKTMWGDLHKVLLGGWSYSSKWCVWVFCIGICPFLPTPIQVTVPRNFNNLLASEVHSQRIRRRNNQTDRGHEHVHASRAGHVPLAALIVVLQDALIAFVHDFL